MHHYYPYDFLESRAFSKKEKSEALSYHKPNLLDTRNS